MTAQNCWLITGAVMAATFADLVSLTTEVNRVQLSEFQQLLSVFIWRFFKIDSIDCSDPGPVEGLSFFNYETEFYHPMQGKSK